MIDIRTHPWQNLQILTKICKQKLNNFKLIKIIIEIRINLWYNKNKKYNILEVTIMQRALENVLGGEYNVVINKELEELKPTGRMLLGEPCAVLYRTDENLGRPVEECEKEEKSCYIVFKPSYTSVACNKDFGAFRNKDSKVKLVSLNYLVDQLLEFNFSFLQLIEPESILFSTPEFDKIVKRYREQVKGADRQLYTKLTSIAINVYSDMKSGKITNPDTISNRLFLCYTLCNVCTNISNKVDHSYLKNTTYMSEYIAVKNEYTYSNNFNRLKGFIETMKVSRYNIPDMDKEQFKQDKFIRMTNILAPLVADIIGGEQ